MEHNIYNSTCVIQCCFIIDSENKSLLNMLQENTQNTKLVSKFVPFYHVSRKDLSLTKATVYICSFNSAHQVVGRDHHLICSSSCFAVLRDQHNSKTLGSHSSPCSTLPTREKRKQEQNAFRKLPNFPTQKQRSSWSRF